MIPEAFEFAADAVAEALGEEISYEGQAVRAVFGAGFDRVQSGEVRVSSKRPEINVPLANLPTDPLTGSAVEPTRGHAVVIRGQDYEVVTSRPDVENVSATLTLKATG